MLKSENLEIFENILLQMRPIDVVRARRVSTRFNSLIIGGSPPVWDKLLLWAPATPARLNELMDVVVSSTSSGKAYLMGDESRLNKWKVVSFGRHGQGVKARLDHVESGHRPRHKIGPDWLVRGMEICQGVAWVEVTVYFHGQLITTEKLNQRQITLRAIVDFANDALHERWTRDHMEQTFSEEELFDIDCLDFLRLN